MLLTAVTKRKLKRKAKKCGWDTWGEPLLSENPARLLIRVRGILQRKQKDCRFSCDFPCSLTSLVLSYFCYKLSFIINLVLIATLCATLSAQFLFLTFSSILHLLNKQHATIFFIQWFETKVEYNNAEKSGHGITNVSGASGRQMRPTCAC